jgi:hypothetical protein
LVSRLLQVLGGIANRAPNAHIIVTNYPIAVDPANPHSVALIKERDLVTVQKFVLDLNATIERAVTICACADLVDLTEALDGHEAYTEKSAYAEPAADEPHPTALAPNDRGAALMADPLASELATALGIRAPRPTRGKVTVPTNIAARNGESDMDGDLVPDRADVSPEDRSHHHKKRDRPLVVVDPVGRDGRHSKPKRWLPVQVLPPAMPHRDLGARPAHRKASEPDAGERKPAPKQSVPAVPTQDSLVRSAPHGFAGTDKESVVDVAPKERPDHSAGCVRLRDSSPADLTPKAPARDSDDDEFATTSDREFAPTGDIRSPQGLRAEPVEETPLTESSWRAAAEEVSPVMPVTEVPRVRVRWRAEPPEEPVVDVVPMEQATDDGEPVCILIYPAPEGCES